MAKELKELFADDSVDKQFKITYDGGVIGNDQFLTESMELEEVLCSEESLTFGCCCASTLKITVLNNIIPLKGKQLEMSCVLKGAEEAPFTFGRYKVDSDKPTADRKYRDIVAYDAIYDINKAEVSDWYNSLTFPLSLKQFRDSFFSHLGIEQESITLTNDSAIVEKTVDPSELSGQTVITAICEINGCFGHIGRNGKFQYIVLKEMVEGLYPSDTLYPSDALYPADTMNAEEVSSSHYQSCTYEDFVTERIDQVQIRKEENDIGKIYPEAGRNCYIVQDNFLVYGKGSKELQIIAQNLLSVIGKVWYRPAEVTAKGTPCLEVGDGICLRTRYEIIYTYILSRTLKGIQALTDSYSASGTQYQSEKVSGIHEQIVQIKGKTNVLTRTIEETKSEIVEVEKGLSSRITQNAEAISLEVTRATGVEGSLSSQISVNAQQITLKVSKNNIVSEINQTAESIKISAQRIDLVGLVNADELVSKFATITTLNAAKAELKEVIAEKATINALNAVKATVDSINADYASVGELSAATAELGSMVAQKATIEQLNVVSLRLQTVESNYISAGTVKAEYMEVSNWTSSGVIKAERLSANTIASKLASLDIVSLRALGVTGYMNYKGTVVAWRTKTIGGTTFTYLGPES